MLSLLSTIVTSAVVATVVGALINAWIEGRKRHRSTRLEALRAAIILEGYAIVCAERITEHENAVSSGGHLGALLGHIPDLPDLPVVTGFLKPQKASVADRLLVFAQEVQQADQMARFWWEVEGDEGATQNEATFQAARVGSRALKLAAEVRAAFKLPSRALVFDDFDVCKYLEERVQAKAERDAARAASTFDEFESDEDA